jgi:hypothetical protein
MSLPDGVVMTVLLPDGPENVVAVIAAPASAPRIVAVPVTLKAENLVPKRAIEMRGS